MTHLVEMQETQPQFEAAAIKLYAVSYDEQAALSDFARDHGITYTLLSDADSRVIREYGIMNTGISKHEAPFYGMAYPGTYIIDEQGIVIAKYFSRHIAMRENAETFIDSALGTMFANETHHQMSEEDEDVSIDVSFYGGSAFKHGLQRKIVVRFKLRDGLHINGEPVPTGMVATSVTIDGPEGFHSGEPSYPPSEPLRLEAMNADLQVWSGQVDIVIPVWVNDPLAPLNSQEMTQDSVDLTINVRYQACDDKTCRIPRTETFPMRIPIEPATTPRVAVFKGSARTTNMQTNKHLKQMVWRSLKRRPWKAFPMLRYLIHQTRTSRRAPRARETSTGVGE